MRKLVPHSMSEHLGVLVCLNTWCSNSVCHGRTFEEESNTYKSLQANSQEAMRNNNAYKTSENKVSGINRLG